MNVEFSFRFSWKARLLWKSCWIIRRLPYGCREWACDAIYRGTFIRMGENEVCLADVAHRPVRPVGDFASPWRP